MMEAKTSIPIVSFEPYLSGHSTEKFQTAQEITNAFQKYGFLYLKDHGIPASTVAEVFSSSAKFFSRTQNEKDSLEWTDPQSNRGYVTMGKEKLSLDVNDSKSIRATNPDLKETMNIGRDNNTSFPNYWPDGIDEEGKAFKATMLQFYQLCNNLNYKIMGAIALGMGLPEDFFTRFIDASDNNLRLLHYPPVLKDVFKNDSSQIRAGEHTDYGSLTLLFQDSRGGLQVRSPWETYEDITPIPDTIVINAGDLLARWSNDMIKSTRHRVVEPVRSTEEGDEEADSYPSRYSIAYFCIPNKSAQIEALPGTFGDMAGKEKIYPAITAGDYLVQQLTATI